MAQRQFTCRWAALSLSNIASVFLPDLLLPRESSTDIKHELVAVSTTGSASRASDWLTQHKIPNAESVAVYHSWEEMLEHGGFDVVYVSTPHPLHYAHVQKALRCKRNVLVEKPATMNRAQFIQLCRLAKEQNVVLMEAMWTRYLPATLYFQHELLPRIGEVKRVYSEFSFPIVSSDLSPASRLLDKAAGAGSLLDQGVYALTWVDLALNCHPSTSDRTQTEVVHAHSIPLPDVKGQVDDIDTIILAKSQIGKSGSKRPEAIAIVTTSMTLAGSGKPAFYQRLQATKPAPAVRIEATKASVSIPFPPIRPEELQVQWYDDEHLDENSMETEEVVKIPVERGWGIWYQADVIAERVARRTAGSEYMGVIIGEEESGRVLGWMDRAREMAGIVYNTTLEEV